MRFAVDRHATGGRIANNTFGIVGQLRHFDGVFEDNLVKGDTSLFGEVFSNQAVQFDGFHGSRFRNNTIYGFVDVKLHGHHHGSGFQEGSHYHGAEAEKEEADAHAMHGPDVDHTKRYHEVFITNNKIFADGMYALRYTDQAHAGDDRTAPSETNPDLNKSHTHFTRVHLVGNKLTGAGLMVDIFNADDERHIGTQTGLVDIRDNVITLEREGFRYVVRTPLVRALLVVMGLVMLAAAVKSPIEPLYILRVLHGQPEMLGFIGGAWGIGMVLGLAGALARLEDAPEIVALGGNDSSALPRGVGHLAVQIAKAQGAYVIGTARADKHDFLRSLGADELIDYTTTDFAEAVRDVDVVLDGVGGPYGDRSVPVLRRGGHLVTLPDPGGLPDAERARQAGVHTGWTIVEPDRHGMLEIARLVTEGRLRAEVAETFPLERAAEAHAMGELSRTQGKLVLTVA